MGAKNDSAGFRKSAEVRLVIRAVKQRWPIREETRQDVVNLLGEAVKDENLTMSIRIKAAKALAMLDEINLKEELKEELDEHREWERMMEARIAGRIAASKGEDGEEDSADNTE